MPEDSIMLKTYSSRKYRISGFYIEQNLRISFLKGKEYFSIEEKINL